jgi:hypothetical protein
MITFASYFTIRKALGCKTFPKCGAGLGSIFHHRLVRHAFMIVSRFHFVCFFVCGVFKYSQLHKVPFAWCWKPLELWETLNTPPSSFVSRCYQTPCPTTTATTRGFLPLVVCRKSLTNFGSLHYRLQLLFGLKNTPMFYANFRARLDLKSV